MLMGAALVMSGVGAVGPTAAQTSPTENYGFVRFIHTSIDMRAVDIFAGETNTLIVSNLDYGQATEFMALPSTTQGFVARPAGFGPDAEPLFQLNRRVKANQSEIIAAAGLTNRRAFVLEALVMVRNATRNKARVRVFNMVWGGPYLSVRDTKGIYYGQDLQYLSTSADVDTAPGVYDFELVSGTGKSVTTAKGVNLEADKVYSLMIIGGMDGDPPVQLVILVSEQETTRVRIVNKSSNNADIYIKGNTEPFARNLPPGQSTDFNPVPSGATTFVLRAANSAPTSPELSFVAPQLRPGRDVTITLDGAGIATQMGITEDRLTPTLATPMTSGKVITPTINVGTPAGTTEATAAATQSP